MDYVGEFFKRDRKLAMMLMALSFGLFCIGTLLFDSALVSFSGVILQVAVVFFIGFGEFAKFFYEGQQKVAGCVMVLGLLLAIKGHSVVGAVLEWGAFLYLFKPFRGTINAILRFVAKKAGLKSDA